MPSSQRCGGVGVSSIPHAQWPETWTGEGTCTSPERAGTQVTHILLGLSLPLAPQPLGIWGWENALRNEQTASCCRQGLHTHFGQRVKGGFHSQTSLILMGPGKVVVFWHSLVPIPPQSWWGTPRIQRLLPWNPAQELGWCWHMAGTPEEMPRVQGDPQRYTHLQHLPVLWPCTDGKTFTCVYLFSQVCEGMTPHSTDEETHPERLHILTKVTQSRKIGAGIPPRSSDAKPRAGRGSF